MGERRLDWQDLLFGLFLVAVAVITLIATRHLTVGRPANMGPGFMPLAIALAILAFGLWYTVRGLLKPHLGIARIEPRPILAIIASVAIFALTANRLGLAISSFLAIIVASFATREARPVETVIFAIAISAAAVLLFVKVLALPVPIWPF